MNSKNQAARASRSAMAYNRSNAEEYFNSIFEGIQGSAQRSGEHVDLTSSVRNFMNLFQAQTHADEYTKQLVGTAYSMAQLPPPLPGSRGDQAASGDGDSPRGDLPKIPTLDFGALADNPQLMAQFTRNLKQRILNKIKERIAHCTLRRQMEIIDGISGPLDRDPFKVLELVGFEAVLCDDEHNIPKTAKDVDDETKKRNERKLQEMAQDFCLMNLSVDVMNACDKNTTVRKRLYEL